MVDLQQFVRDAVDRPDGGVAPAPPSTINQVRPPAFPQGPGAFTPDGSMQALAQRAMASPGGTSAPTPAFAQPMMSDMPSSYGGGQA